MKRERGLTLLVVAAGLLSLSAATDGFRAVTSEGARRLSVEREPRALEEVVLVDHTGEPFSWSDYTGQPLLVEFIFTSCPTVCQKMSSDFRALVSASGENSSVRFVSVSFDLENDTVEQLQRVAGQYGADGRRWRFARVSEERDLGRLLDEFGVVAIPSATVGFEHNTAIHGVDRAGRLARIEDISRTEEMLRWAEAL